MNNDADNCVSLPFACALLLRLVSGCQLASGRAVGHYGRPWPTQRIHLSVTGRGSWSSQRERARARAAARVANRCRRNRSWLCAERMDGSRCWARREGQGWRGRGAAVVVAGRRDLQREHLHRHAPPRTSRGKPPTIYNNICQCGHGCGLGREPKLAIYNNI